METTEPTYSGSAYHPDLGNEMAYGEITLSQWTIYFRGETVALDFPLQGLQIDVPRDDSERIVFLHPTHPGWRMYTNDYDILENRNIISKTALRQQVQKIVERDHNWRKLLWITLGVFGGFMTVALTIFLLTGWTLNFLVTKIPTTYEKQIGNDVLEEMKTSVRFVNNTNATQQIALMAKGFIPEAEQKRFDFKFYIIDVDEPNAMALPGGNILITTGLLEMTEEPEELIGVLAHEVAHVTERHGVKHIVSQVGPYLLLKAFLKSDSGFLGLVGHGSRLLITQNFSQKYETEADDVAWQYLTKAKINPEGLITFLRKLKEQSGHLEELEVQALSSHPPTADRIQRLEGKWKKLENKTGFVELSDSHFKAWK